MRRADLLHLTGLSATLFNAHVLRGTLPLDMPPGRHWARFSAGDALKLQVFLNLAKAGRPQQLAGALVRAEFDRVLEFAQASEGSGDVLFGSFGHEVGDDQAAAVAYLPLVSRVGGSGLEREVFETLKRAGISSDGLCEIVMVNVSRSMRQLIGGAGERDDLRDQLAEFAARMRI